MRRQEILTAAETVVLEKGVAAFGVGDVTARAGVAKGSFYLHFDSKDAVVAALRDRFVDGLLAQVVARVETHAPSDWNGRLEAWVRHGLSVCLSPSTLALNEALFHGAGGLGLREDLASHGRGIAVLRELIAGGDAAGAWSAPDPQLIAAFLYFALHGALDHAGVSGTLDPGPLADDLLRLHRRVLRPD